MCAIQGMTIALTEFQTTISQVKYERHVRPDTMWVFRKIRESGTWTKFKTPAL